jgi:hypothetical protein
LPDLSSGKELIPAQIGSGGMDTFYKWYDPKGNVQFTTEPPPAGVAYTVKQYDPNANLIQAVKLPEGNTGAMASAPEANEKPAPEKSATESSLQAQESPYDSEGIGKLFEDAKNIQNMINQRINSQNDTIN